MFKYLKTLAALKNDRRGVTMLEYAIMGAVIAAALVLVVPLLTRAINTDFTTIATTVTSGASTAGANVTGGS